MYHIIHVGMSGDVLRQLDELRRAYPDLRERKDILLHLVAEAHKRLSLGASESAKFHGAA